MELMQASRQWATRPDDERFTSLYDLHADCERQRNQSRGKVVAAKSLHFAPATDTANPMGGLTVQGAAGKPYFPTHWSFGQLATLAKAPAGYLRTLPSPIVADNLNYGMQFTREVEDVQVLLEQNGQATLRAATGPTYGRVWNSDITAELTRRFGDGTTGDWRVPGEFRKQVTVTKDNTTLYKSDRDMFVFLADETNRITIPNRRASNGGQVQNDGTMARGFFMWNSEVGSSTWGIAMFLFDYVCCNRIVWGAQGYREVKIRHTSGAPDRWFNEVQPMLKAYAHASEEPIQAAFKAAQDAKLADRNQSLEQFLKSRRYAASMAPKLEAIHKAEEGRPVETMFDVVTALTAYARGVEYQDERVALERDAGKILDLVAA